MNKNLVADISQFQPKVNYKGLSQEVLFTWVRISDGANYYDRKVDVHIKGFNDAKANNYGYYWFLRPWNYQDGYNEATQVLKWVNELEKKNGHDTIQKSKRPIMLDVEQFTNTSGSMRQAVQGCVDALLKAGLSQSQIWIYVACDKFESFNLNLKGFKTIVPKYAYANQTVNTPYYSVQPYKGENLWQYTCTYSSKNVDGWMDMSIFMNGTKPEVLYPFGKNIEHVSEVNKPTYYNAVLKRIRLKQTTKIYKDKYLNDPVRSYPKDTEFELVPEKPFKTKSGATRYKTESGYYITGNQDYVNSIYYLDKCYDGKKTIELKQAAYLYKDKYFEERIRKYDKGTRFNIVENVALSSGRRCFKTESGYYITANKDYSKFVK